MTLFFEEEYSVAIIEKCVKDIIFGNYSDEILMVEFER